MLFSVGVETPKTENEAYGLVVPALCSEDYSCFSAADTANDIAHAATDAIASVLEDMADNGIDTSAIADAGFDAYRTHEDYQYCDTWLLLEVDITDYLGKHQRVNITIPDYILQRIDKRVSDSREYKNRSHFLTVAAQHELSA